MSTKFRFPIAVKHYARTISMENAITRAVMLAEGEKPSKLEALHWVKSILNKDKKESS